MQESARVDAGHEIAPLIDVDGMKVGLMTCYDLRFPELALSLALQGADILALPAAWVRGPLKERHWATLLAARALDTTCYIVASGECGNKNIGLSQVVDPQGWLLPQREKPRSSSWRRLRSSAYRRRGKNYRYCATAVSLHRN
jgi:predicted amidohydrolase